MKFARKLIHVGPVHHCYEPVGALHECMVLSECMLDRWFYLHGLTLTLVQCAWKNVFLPRDLNLCPMTLIFKVDQDIV